MSHDDDKKEKHRTDADEVREILEVVSVEIPKLLESLSKQMYDPSNAENMGKSLAQFYKQLVDAGMDEAKAAQLTEKYMTSTSIGGIIGQALSGGKDSDIGKAIKDKIKKEIEDDD
ncbi:MAG: hypothetical protein JSU93_04580 [Methanobacteriota archaeon]|nr:MAG: hypothetical protein JSU93_04580 [Euryarchaeota archaeon]